MTNIFQVRDLSLAHCHYVLIMILYLIIFVFSFSILIILHVPFIFKYLPVQQSLFPPSNKHLGPVEYKNKI